MGTQKNRLKETGFFEHPKQTFKLEDKKIIVILHYEICFTGPMNKFGTTSLIWRFGVLYEIRRDSGYFRLVHWGFEIHR